MTAFLQHGHGQLLESYCSHHLQQGSAAPAALHSAGTDSGQATEQAMCFTVADCLHLGR